MTVTELLERILSAYPGATPEAMRTYVPVFHARLKSFKGDKLEQAATTVLAEFKPTTRQPFPIPRDLENHLPSRAIDLPDEGPKLDFAGRTKRAEVLFRDWREGQGKRAASDVPQVMRALEAVAGPICRMRGFSDRPEPLALTRKQVKIAQQVALSTERRGRHQDVPKDPRAWWEQIKAIADEWRMAEVTPEWWSDDAAKTLNRKEAA